MAREPDVLSRVLQIPERDDTPGREGRGDLAVRREVRVGDLCLLMRGHRCRRLPSVDVPCRQDTAPDGVAAVVVMYQGIDSVAL